MTKRYIVIGLETCQHCNGEGMVIHRLWQEYYSEFPQGEKDVVEWFSEHGYSKNKIPDEEIPCPHCNDNGEIETRVPLLEALTIIKNDLAVEEKQLSEILNKGFVKDDNLGA